jgi:hypothetical protein
MSMKIRFCFVDMWQNIIWATSQQNQHSARMHRLVWIHAGRKRTMLVLSWRGSYLFSGSFIVLWRRLKELNYFIIIKIWYLYNYHVFLFEIQLSSKIIYLKFVCLFDWDLSLTKSVKVIGRWSSFTGGKDLRWRSVHYFRHKQSPE